MNGHERKGKFQLLNENSYPFGIYISCHGNFIFFNADGREYTTFCEEGGGGGGGCDALHETLTVFRPSYAISDLMLTYSILGPQNLLFTPFGTSP